MSVELFQQQRAEQARRSSDQRPPSIQRVRLDSTQLGSAKSDGAPYAVRFPFKSVYVESATDSNVSVKISLHSQDAGQIANYITLKQGDSMVLDQFVSQAWLTWDAQSGKEITLLFFTDSEFRTGSIRSVSAGGINVTEGTSASNRSVTLTAAAAVQLFPVNADRKVETVVNTTGTTLYLGPSGVSNTTGLPWSSGSQLVWKNQGELYVYSPTSAASLATLLET